MAQLFKKNIVKEKLQSYEIPNFDEKIEVLKNWYNLHNNWTLKAKKEEELEWPFWADFFGKILDYSSFWENEIYNRKFQPKVPEWGQKADIGLWFFGEEKEIMKVVVELKDAKTSLDKPQQRAWNLTPVQQAFKYKPYFNDCDFIIVSNFYETRLYIDSYYDYEAWTLSDLVNPKDNYFNFRRFYYLLNRQNLITKKGESNTKSLLSLIRIQEKEITKQFYKEYTVLRKELFKDIVANNPWFKKTELDFLLNKTQKIIDRIIFIHFCEDLGLLPQGKLKEVIEYGEKSLATTWETLSNFFRAVDKGSDKLWIPDWYNGWLFHHDEELNNLKVWDKICKKFIDMWEYDFADDLSVNILGHIFEQSISDIEELKDKINKQEEATLSKRKKDWVFYTPEYIVDYIVKNSVWKKIEQWEEELKEKHNLKEDITDKNYTKRAVLVYEELQEKIHNIKVLDPACWSGAFLVKVFDFLLDKNIEISKKLEDLWVNQGLFSSESYFKTILQNNIYWVDLNEESVEITKLSLWLKTASKGKKLANLDSNIKCGNSLIDDKEIAGDKAFVWEDEFKEIFDNWGFDVVVWNPPYWAKLDEKIISFCNKKYITGEWNFDTYTYFISLLNYILKDWWICSYITPNTWFNLSSYKTLRKDILNNYNLVELINLLRVFEDAMVDCWIFILKKWKNSNNKVNIYRYEQVVNSIEKINLFMLWKYLFYYTHNQEDYLKQDDFSIDYLKNPNFKNIIDKIESNKTLLWDITHSSRWASFYWVWAWSPVQTKEMVDNKVYSSNEKIDETYYPAITWWYINRYKLFWFDEYIKYWKHLFRAREPMFFFKPHIVIQRFRKWMVRQIIWTLIDTDIINNDWLSNFIIKDENYDIKYLLPLLNSRLLDFWFQQYYKDTNVRPTDLNMIPIKDISLSEQKTFIEKANFMLDKNKELQEKVNKFIKRLNSSFEIEKLSKKLETFYDLEFSDFVKELKKKKVELSLKDQDEWEEYFDSYKKEILELKSEIDACDNEIDEMVFELYGLSEDERSVVLEA